MFYFKIKIPDFLWKSRAQPGRTKGAEDLPLAKSKLKKKIKYRIV